VILVVFLLSVSFDPPAVSSASSGPPPPAGTLSTQTADTIFRDFYDVQKRAFDRENNVTPPPEVLSDRDLWEPKTLGFDNPREGMEIEEEEGLIPSVPAVIYAADSFHPEKEYNNIYDYLANNIFSYYIYIPYLGTDEDWNEGSMAPRFSDLLVGGEYNSNWVPIDIDNADNDSDDTTGTDIEARINPSLYLERINLGGRTATGTGGLDLEIKNLNWPEPLDIYFLKGFKHRSSDGENLTDLICISLRFDTTPNYSLFNLHAEQLEFTINTESQPMGNNSLVNISGPVSISWNISQRIGYLDVGAIYVSKVENETVSRNWVTVKVRPGWGNSTIPTHAMILGEYEDINYGFNDVTWNTTDRINASLEFVEEETNTTYAIVSAENMSTWLHIHLERIEGEEENLTALTYDSSEVISSVRYSQYQYLGSRIANISSSTPRRFLNFSLSNLPTHLYVETTLETQEPLEFGPPSRDFVGSLIQRVSARFKRVGKTVGSIPDKILSMTTTGGYAYLEGKSPMDVCFYLTDGEYISSPGNHFFGYLNTSRGDVPIAFSGRLSGLKKLNAVIGNRSHIEVEMNTPLLYGFVVDKNSGVEARVVVEDIPPFLVLGMEPGRISLWTSQLDGEAEDRMSLRMVIRSGENTAQINVTDIPPALLFLRNDDGFTISSGTYDIGGVEIYGSNGRPEGFWGDHVFASLSQTSRTISVALHAIKTFRMNKQNGSILLDTENPSEMVFSLNISDTSGDANQSAAPVAETKMVVDPLPAHFSARFPAFSGLSAVDIPVPTPRNGIMSIPNMMGSISDVWDNLSDSISGSVQKSLTSFGGRSRSSLSVSYDSDRNMDLFGYLRFGSANLSSVKWTNGITGVALGGGYRGAALKINMPGLPKHAVIDTNMSSTALSVSLDIKNFNSTQRWMLFDLAGFQNRTIKMYLDSIPRGVDVQASVSANIRMGRGGGEIDMSGAFNVRKNGTPVGIGAVYAKGSQERPVKTSVDMFIPSVPSDLSLDLSTGGIMYIAYQASETIPYLLLSGYREVRGRNPNFNVIIRDVPARVEGKVMPRRDLDPDGSLLQTVPDILFSASNGTLDMFLAADLAFLGQRGYVGLSLFNLTTWIKGVLAGGEYVFDSDGVEWVDIVMKNIPFSKQFSLHEFHLQVRDLRGVSLRITPLYGFYPVIELDNRGSGSFSFTVRVLGPGSMEMNLAIVDISTRSGAMGSVPTTPFFMINGGNVYMDNVPRHILLVDPGLSLLFSVMAGGWM